MKRYMLSALLAASLLVPAFAGLHYVGVKKLEDGTSVKMTREAMNAYDNGTPLQEFVLKWGVYYLPQEKTDEYVPAKYENESDFSASFRSSIALNGAAQKTTEIRMNLLAETFAWLDFLKENDYIAAGTDEWETANLNNLDTEEGMDFEFLSIDVYKELTSFIGMLDEKVGVKYRTETPLDIARQGAALYPKRNVSMCALTFEAGCKQMAEKVRTKINNGIQSIKRKKELRSRLSR